LLYRSRVSNHARLTSDFRRPLFRRPLKRFTVSPRFAPQAYSETPTNPRSRNTAKAGHILGTQRITIGLGNNELRLLDHGRYAPDLKVFGVNCFELPTWIQSANRVAFQMSTLIKYFVQKNQEDHYMILRGRFAGLLSQTFTFDQDHIHKARNTWHRRCSPDL
jgi:hypothetical protein